MTFSASIKIKLLFLSALTAGALGACGSSDDGGGAAVDASTSTCGNGVVDGTEECDGQQLKGATCQSKTLGVRPGGTLSCVNCHLVDTGCTSSGSSGATGAGGFVGAAGATMMIGNGGAPAIGGATGSGGTTGSAAGGKGGTSGTAGQAGAPGGKGGTGGTP